MTRILLVIVSCLLLYVTLKFVRTTQRIADKQAIDVEISLLKNNVPKKVVLFICILSAYKYKERRDGIRQTWLNDCRSKDSMGEARCDAKFFMDSDAIDDVDWNLPSNANRMIKAESKANNDDIVLLENSYSGSNFGTKYIKALMYADREYIFDYFLRVDDDYYLCLHRILNELRLRYEYNLFWGYGRGTRLTLDEGYVMISRNVSMAFLGALDRLVCADFGTATLASWIYDIMADTKTKIDWFTDNLRVFHHPPVGQIPEFYERTEICHSFIAMHGVYLIDNYKRFHKIMLSENRTFTLPPVYNKYPFEEGTRLVLKGALPCQENPIYDRLNQGRGYGGRNRHPRKNYTMKDWKIWGL